MQADVEFDDVGRRIRSLRKQREYTLEQLGELSGLSVSYLSQIENGHANLHLRVLRDIAQALRVPMIDFLVRDEDQDISLVRVADRRTYSLESGASETLLYARDRLDMEATILTIPAGATSGRPNVHAGEEFSFILAGRVRMIIGEDRSFDLEAGDIIYYRSTLPHRWENPFDANAQVLVTNTPATF